MDADAWDARHRARAGRHREPNPLLVAAAASLAAGRALDLACGSGRNAVWLAEHNWRVTAVDFSPVALDQARAAARDHAVTITTVQADARAYTPVGRFDLVVVSYLHLPAVDMRGVWRVACVALAAGGTLLAVGHHTRNLTDGYGGPSDPTLLWDERVIATLLDRLVIDETRVVTRPVRDEDGDHAAIDALVRAHRPR
jgi:SAM-dependent methyltransferase